MGKRLRSAPSASLIDVVTKASRSSDLELGRILQVREGHEPSHKQFHDARHHRAQPLMREIEVEKEGGGTWQWPLCQPNLLFSTLVAESAQLQQVIEEALRTSPGTRDRPWHLIVGFDEFVPGNKLQLQPSRKAMNLSFTFLELGSDGVGEVGSIGAGFFANMFPCTVSIFSNMILGIP